MSLSASKSKLVERPRRHPLRAFADRFRAVLQLDDSPRSIALGLFWGTVIAWTPTVGLQMIIAILVASMLRVNRLAAVVMVWLSNPLTLVPMYWLEYRVGKWMLNASGFYYDPWTRERFSALFERVMEQDLWPALVTLADAGWSLLFPMCVGGLPIGAVNGLILGLAVYRYLNRGAVAPKA